MILFRRNAFSDTSKEIKFIEGETLKDLNSRILVEENYPQVEGLEEHFQILVNGHKIDREMWGLIIVKEDDEIMIAPELKRGEGAETFKQFALIAAFIVISVYVPPLFASPLAGAFAAAGASIGATLLLNALIPPPEIPGLGDLGSLESLDSQMYTISSQANSTKKYGNVPKVYGTHRMFPTVAANPYTELAADESTNQIVQNFYGLYDFGLGPNIVSDVRIGDTPIYYFEGVEQEYVDFNKPSVDEGEWDEYLNDDLVNYKGGIATENPQYSLNENKEIGTGGLFLINTNLSSYQVTRNAPTSVFNSVQEIVLDFVFPQGLVGYNSAGKTYDRTVELLVEFKKTTEPDSAFKGYNDTSVATNFKTVGGANDVYKDKILKLPESEFFYDKLREYTATETIDKVRYNVKKSEYGFKKGRTVIFVSPDGYQPSLNENIYFLGNTLLGKVISIGTALFSQRRYNFSAGMPRNIHLFTVNKYYTTSDTGGVPAKTRYANLFGNKDLLGDYAPDLDDATFDDDSRIIENLGLFKVKLKTLGAVSITDKITSPKYFSLRFTPKAVADYVIRVTRVRSSSAADWDTRDDLTFLTITSRFNKDEIKTALRHTFLDLKIKATNQLQGSIQNLSAQVTSVLDVYDPLTQTWSKQATNNPAWVFVDLLTGEVNPRPISKSRLHLESIVEWAEYCDEIPTSGPTLEFFDKRFTCNFVLDFNTTLQQLINQVCNSANASLNIVDGKYGVLIDKLRTVPVQIFTPRNSSNFSSSRSYDDTPNALKIRFVSPNKNWEVDEAVIYDDGYDVNNATIFNELSAFACTSYEQAWRYGRYMMAQSKLRKETISIEVDFENLVCTRGDYVKITQDVMKVGGRPARVKSIVGNRIKIDDGIETTAVPYGYTFRSVNGIETNTLTVVDSDEFDLDGPLPSVGDLIIIGPVGFITYDCLVKSINPSDNLTATLTLIEKADAIYDAESSIDFPLYDPIINQTINSEDATPPEVDDLEVVSNTWRVIGQNYQYYIQLDWDIQVGVAYELFEIYVDSGTGYKLIDYSTDSFYEYIVSEENLGIEHSFKVLAVSSNGKKISLIDAPSVEATPETKSTAPSDVEGIFINITNQVIQLEWTRITDPDLKEYLIRYTPATTGATWEVSIPIAKVSGITNTISVQGRTGTYLVKAYDLNGNESTRSAQAITSIPNLFDLNIIDETNDFPTLPGEKKTTVFDGSGLVLKRIVEGDPLNNEYYPEGFYYYYNFLDLGEIYTCRIQSQIQAEGFTVDDLMSNWTLLSEVEALSNAGSGSWDVETYYRGTASLNVMSEWTLLSEIDPLSEGEQDNWTEWKKFTIGDFTFRIAQFRLRLVSYVAAVTPRVFDGKIKADMPDRFESYNNLTSQLTPQSIVYTPPFKGPGNSPNIQVTIDDASSGDYYTISNKTLNGFDIIFYDSSNNPVVRQYDLAIKGFGRKTNTVI